jgi:SAM-dependent methyltransferase
VRDDVFHAYKREGWERAAARYEDCWTDTLLFVEPLLDAAGVGAGTRVLDVGCGPGFVSEAAAARGAEPVGLDVAEAMIERARARSPQLRFVVGDAERLDAADASFDAVTSNFGVLHVPRPEAAMAEARRVLVAGGRFAFTVWVPDRSVPDAIVDDAIAAHAAPVEVPAGPPVDRFADPGECRRALEDAGFEPDGVRVDTVEVAWRLAAPELLFDAHLEAGVQTATVLRSQPPDRLRAIRAAVVEGVRRHADGDAYALPLAARVASAQA